MFGLRTIRKLILALSTSTLCALALAIPALADTAATSCTMSGRAATNPSVKLSGGTGTYAFASGAGATPLNLNCVVRVGASVDVETLTFTSNGTYSNQVCGTGLVTSTDAKGGTITSISRSGGNANLQDDWWLGTPTHTLANQADLSYAIAFTGGQGQLTFTGSGVSGGAFVSIVPAQGEQTTSQCSVHFDVEGAMNASIFGVPTPPPPPPPDVLAAETSPPAGYPSSTCSTQGGAGTSLADVSELGGAVHAWLNQWQVSPTKTDLCVRIHGGGVASAGGLLEVDTTGTPGSPPDVQVADSDTAPTSCPTNLHHTNSPVVSDVSVGTNPPSACVTVGTTTKRVTVASTGNVVSPQVCWTPDPSGTRTCNR